MRLEYSLFWLAYRFLPIFPGGAGPKPALHARFGRFPEIPLRWLPKVKSRGHVYPLSYLPYFESSSPSATPRC
jgi:hypothetical protein